MDEPPFDTGAVQATLASPARGVASTSVGAPGIVMGIIVAEGSDAAERPAALVATTEKV